MRKMLYVLIFCFALTAFAGCHTVRKLTRVNTGQVDLEDILQALVDDDKDFQEEYW